MAQFVSTFLTGFQDVVAEDLEKRLEKFKILNLFDGLIHYQYDGNSRDLEKINYFNNTFFVLKTMKGKGLNFNSLVGAVASENKYYLINKGTFRVRFVNENQFAKVEANTARKAEDTVLRNSKLKIDRVSPSTEIWYSIRREGFAFCGQLISKREFTEKNLHKGELRPELAYLLCSFAGCTKDDVVCDPFCGYGSIPLQLAKNFPYKKLFAFDIDDEKITMLKENRHLKKENVVIARKDSLKLTAEDFVCDDGAETDTATDDHRVSLIITDPPWGYFEDIGDIGDFYGRLFDSVKNIICSGGRMVLLTARVEELKKITAEKSLNVLEGPHTLVNGKKAGVFIITF
jgi:23S rRNA G2445 N2-methylase RlmL